MLYAHRLLSSADRRRHTGFRPYEACDIPRNRRVRPPVHRRTTTKPDRSHGNEATMRIGTALVLIAIGAILMIVGGIGL
jgi:hypothetical protein